MQLIVQRTNEDLPGIIDRSVAKSANERHVTVRDVLRKREIARRKRDDENDVCETT
jgi:hypothetical protein